MSSAIGSSLPILDGIIVIVLLVALFIGYQRGIIQPLMTYLFFFGAVFVIYRERVPYLNGVEKYLHANVVLAIFFALIIAVAFVGTVNPSTGELGMLVPLEHAMLAQGVADGERTSAFARYSLIGALSMAAGSLAAALPDYILRCQALPSSAL